jgi:hypothetical protein
MYDPNSRCDYRSQLHAYLFRVYPQSHWIHHALKGAVPLKRRQGGGSTHYFIAVLPPSSVSELVSAVRLISHTSFTELNGLSPASMSEV